MATSIVIRGDSLTLSCFEKVGRSRMYEADRGQAHQSACQSNGDQADER